MFINMEMTRSGIVTLLQLLEPKCRKAPELIYNLKADPAFWVFQFTEALTPLCHSGSVSMFVVSAALFVGGDEGKEV